MFYLGGVRAEVWDMEEMPIKAIQPQRGMGIKAAFLEKVIQMSWSGKLISKTDAEETGKLIELVDAFTRDRLGGGVVWVASGFVVDISG